MKLFIIYPVFFIVTISVFRVTLFLKNKKFLRKHFLYSFLLSLVAPSVLMVVFLLSSSVYGLIEENNYEETNIFNTCEWKKDHLYRFSVLKHVISEVATKGSTAEEIRNSLGEPDRIDEKGHWHYKSKRPGFRFIDFSGGGLELTFQQGILLLAKDTTWVD